MILYDQDFNFIGMSAETLTFLGYEDLDEFTSMHADFADLFVKKEGYIHKFENFSWIHYILYSGAANKKAYVKQKNGSEVTVDITIKEVFLTDKYEGLQRVYSVKLINENFTNISKTDIHDKRSKKNHEFSLKKLTKGLDIPEPQSQPADSMPKPQVETETTVQNRTTEASEFVLDMPDSSIFATPEEATVTEPAPISSGEFVLKTPPLTDTEEQEEEPVMTHLNLDATEPAFTQKSKTREIAEEKEEEEMKIDLFAHSQNDTLQQPAEPEPQEKSEQPASEPKPFSFDLFKKSTETEESDSDLFQKRGEEQEEPSDKTPFSFDLLKKDTEAVSEPQTLHEAHLSVAEENRQQIEEEKPSDEKPLFSFDLFKKEEPKTENRTIADAEESEQDETDHLNKEYLIDQIKSDIAEIDADMPVAEKEKELASIKLEELLIKKADEQSSVEEPQKSESFQMERHEESAKPFEEEQPQKNRPESETTPFAFSPEHETLSQSDAFEERLKEVFSLAKTLPESADTTNKSNIFNSAEEVSKNKHSVTKEDIKSTIPKSEERDELILPELGKLGLSKEEELDFIDEFLNDTTATLNLMREYLKLEDYDNIKYSLIKISSSAEILHFNQLLEYTQALGALCDSKENEKLSERLNAFEKIVARYKEHFSTIIA